VLWLHRSNRALRPVAFRHRRVIAAAEPELIAFHLMWPDYLFDSTDIRFQARELFDRSCGPARSHRNLHTAAGGKRIYVNPPDKLIVLSVHAKSQIQARDRTQLILPLRPGLAERHTQTTSGTEPRLCLPH